MDRETLHEWLKSGRKLSQTARAVQMSPQHLSGFLKGADGLALKKIVRLVDYLRDEHDLDVTIDGIAREAGGTRKGATA